MLNVLTDEVALFWVTMIVAAGVVKVESLDANTVASAVPGFERPAEMYEVVAAEASVLSAVTVIVHTIGVISVPEPTFVV